MNLFLIFCQCSVLFWARLGKKLPTLSPPFRLMLFYIYRHLLQRLSHFFSSPLPTKHQFGIFVHDQVFNLFLQKLILIFGKVKEFYGYQFLFYKSYNRLNGCHFF
jgi:hypothetical protein